MAQRPDPQIWELSWHAAFYLRENFFRRLGIRISRGFVPEVTHDPLI